MWTMQHSHHTQNHVSFHAYVYTAPIETPETWAVWEGYQLHYYQLPTPRVQTSLHLHQACKLGSVHSTSKCQVLALSPV